MILKSEYDPFMGPYSEVQGKEYALIEDLNVLYLSLMNSFYIIYIFFA